MEPGKRNLKNFGEFDGIRREEGNRGNPATAAQQESWIALKSLQANHSLPLHAACRSKRSPGTVIEYLSSSESPSRSSVEDLTENLDTVLHTACINNNYEAVKALIKYCKKEALWNCLCAQNKDGNTPFHLTSRLCSSGISTLLLQLESREKLRYALGKKNKLGQTCFGIAVGNKDWTTVRLLLQYSDNNPALLYDDFKCLAPECSSMSSSNLEVRKSKPVDVFVMGDQGCGKTTLINGLVHAMQPSGLANLFASFGSGRTYMETPSIGIVPTTTEFHRQLKVDRKCLVTFHDVNSYHGYSHEAIFKYCMGDPLDTLHIITVDMTKDVESSILYWLHFLSRKLAEFSVALSAEDKSRKLKFVVVGTFADHSLTSSSPRQLDIDSIIRRTSHADMLVSSLTCLGIFNVNAKKVNSSSPSLSTIVDFCDSIHQVRNESNGFLAQTYILAYLIRSFPKNEAISFRHIQGMIKNSSSTLWLLLPQNREEINKICNNLKRFSQFKILRITRRKVHEFIVLDYPHLIRSIEKGLASLKECSKHGIVSRQDIKESIDYGPTDFVICFLEEYSLCEKISKRGLDDMRTSIRTSLRSKRISNLSQTSGTQRGQFKRPVRGHRRSRSDSDSIVDFSSSTLERKSPSKNEILSISNEEPKRSISSSNDHGLSSSGTPQRQPSLPGQHSSNARPSMKREVPYYFLPSLIPRNRPREVWDNDSDEYGYGFAWCLVPPVGDTWFLSYKFTTVVLFRLLFSYAPQPSSKSEFTLDRMCELWDEGIIWCDPQGARVCVCISDRSKIILSMHCLKGSEIACLSIRNEIMKDIREQLHEIHPNISPREIFLPYDGNQDIFPVFDIEMSYVSFDKEEIKKAIFGECTVISTNGKHNKHVESLLYFEPLCFLQAELLHELFDLQNGSTMVSENYFMMLAKSLSSKWIHLARHWESVLQKYYIESLQKNSVGSPHDTAFEMLVHLKDIDYDDPDYRLDTYNGLQRSLFEISVFSPECIIQT